MSIKEIKPLVTIMTHTKDMEQIIASAAKLCYSNDSIEDILKKNEDGTEKFITMLSSMGHESVFEHASITFGIEGVSRAFTHQLVRHRIASYSQKSQRYVDESTFSYVVPKEIENCPIAMNVFLEHMKDTHRAYGTIANTLTWKYISIGMSERDASKKAYENARSVLPNATATSIVVTMNLRSLLNFFKHRLCTRAQDEIREVSAIMYNLSVLLAPSALKNAGPSCVSGRCSEGKLSCGSPIKKVGGFIGKV